MAEPRGIPPDQVQFGSPGERRFEPRSAMVVLAAVAVGALVVAGGIWTIAQVSDEDDDELTMDQAACLRYALIERRLDAQAITAEAWESLDLPAIPRIRRALHAEVAALDSLVENFPMADPTLLSAFAAVGDAAEVALSHPQRYGTSVNFINGIKDRFDVEAETDAACLETGFDVDTLSAL